MNWMNSTYEFRFVMQSIVRTILFMLPIMVYEQLLRCFLILTYEFKKVQRERGNSVKTYSHRNGRPGLSGQGF